MVWLGYAGIVLILSGAVGWHLRRFHAAFTEMTGMMAGMTMGMLNGFVLGYCAAAATNSMFWGNFLGILLGLALGLYFGRPGGPDGHYNGPVNRDSKIGSVKVESDHEYETSFYRRIQGQDRAPNSGRRADH